MFDEAGRIDQSKPLTLTLMGPMRVLISVAAISSLVAFPTFAQRIGPRDVDVVCATGGTAKVPRIAEALRARFGAERLQEFQHFHSVVHGLAEEARATL